MDCHIQSSDEIQRSDDEARYGEFHAYYVPKLSYTKLYSNQKTMLNRSYAQLQKKQDEVR